MIKLLELFGGIGACSKAFDRLGIKYEIADYVEIDKYAVKSYNAIHNTNFEPQDITNWNKDIDVDFIMHGSPCQDFSLAGLQKGGDENSGTRSSLMYETIRIVKKLKPKYILWENVKNLISKKHIHNFNNYLNIMSELGYNNYYKVLNSKNYGIPQNRERIFTLSIRQDVDNGTFTFPKEEPLQLKLKDMLEENVDEKYFLSDKMVNYISATGTQNFKLNDSRINLDIARPLTTDNNKRAGTSNYISKELPDNYNLKIKNATKQGYLLAQGGDGIDISSRMIYHRGTVQKGMIQTLTTQSDRGVVVNYSQESIERIKRNIIKGEVANTLTANAMQSINHNNCELVTIKNKRLQDTNDLRIRKLTPKECWRLMGFDDEDFDKASKVNSNAQLYKQARK